MGTQSTSNLQTWFTMSINQISRHDDQLLFPIQTEIHFSVYLAAYKISISSLIKSFINSKSKDQSSFHRAITLISEEFSKLGSSVSQIDPTLVPAIEAENLKVISSLQTLEDKVMRLQQQVSKVECCTSNQV